MLQRYCSCGAPVYWLVNRETGKKAPINTYPEASGTIVILPNGLYTIWRKGEPLPPRTPLYTSHFSTCPSAAVYRGQGRNASDIAQGKQSGDVTQGKQEPLISLFVAGAPVSVNSAYGSKGSRRYKSEAAAAWAGQITASCIDWRKAHGEVEIGPLSFAIVPPLRARFTFFGVRGDADNYIKITQDALIAALWLKNDNGIKTVISGVSPLARGQHRGCQIELFDSASHEQPRNTPAPAKPVDIVLSGEMYAALITTYRVARRFIHHPLDGASVASHRKQLALAVSAIENLELAQTIRHLEQTIRHLEQTTQETSA